ncbi:MAG: phosphatase PAP2 family protein [Nitrospirales bacterium]|nr:phosphatase PAP2 family protein [Nitrospirales bacterium]
MTQSIFEFDREWFTAINGLAGQSALLDEVMFQFSQEGNLIVPGIFLAVYWSWQHWGEARIAIPCLLLLLGLSDFLGGQLKNLIGRSRPCQVLDQVNQLVGCGGSFSMPSNHAFNSSTAMAFLMVLYPSLGWVLVPVLMLIGLSRVYLGAHYLTDVLVGVVVGIALGGGVAVLLKKKIYGREGVSK